MLKITYFKGECGIAIEAIKVFQKLFSACLLKGKKIEPVIQYGLYIYIQEHRYIRPFKLSTH